MSLGPSKLCKGGQGRTIHGSAGLAGVNCGVLVDPRGPGKSFSIKCLVGAAVTYDLSALRITYTSVNLVGSLHAEMGAVSNLNGLITFV
jgi:hypothetical protein